MLISSAQVSRRNDRTSVLAIVNNLALQTRASHATTAHIRIAIIITETPLFPKIMMPDPTIITTDCHRGI